MNNLQEKLHKGKPLMWSERVDNHLYIYRNGELVYKRWVGKRGGKTQPSLLFNPHTPPHEWII